MKFDTALKLMKGSYIVCTRNYKIDGVKLCVYDSSEIKAVNKDGRFSDTHALTLDDLESEDWIPDIRTTLVYRNRFVPFPEAEDINSAMDYITDKLIELGKQERGK